MMLYKMVNPPGIDKKYSPGTPPGHFIYKKCASVCCTWALSSNLLIPLPGDSGYKFCSSKNPWQCVFSLKTNLAPENCISKNILDPNKWACYFSAPPKKLLKLFQNHLMKVPGSIFEISFINPKENQSRPLWSKVMDAESKVKLCKTTFKENQGRPLLDQYCKE